MTATDQAPPITDERIEASVKRAVRSYHRHQEDIVRGDFAATVAMTLLAMRPPIGAGEKAAGIAEGLGMAARTILHLAGVPAVTPDNPQEHSDVRR